MENRFVDPPCLSQDGSKVVFRIAIGRLDFQRSQIMRDSLFGQAFLAQSVAQVELSQRHIRVDVERVLVLGDGFVHMT